MKVTLINYTQNAINTLLFTQMVRVKVLPEDMADVVSWPESKKREVLEELIHTTPSALEFVDYIFVIENVTRAFTHQLIRHRAGTSFSQQTQRAVDMADFTYETGPSIQKARDRNEVYDETMLAIKQGYHKLTELGANPQDARGLLPTNIHTNIMFKANLRALHEMALKRLCVKSQGEFQNVFRAIREAVIDIHPWAKDFIKVNCAWNGTCCFPTFPAEDCPVKGVVHNPLTPGKSYDGEEPFSLKYIEIMWEKKRAEAQPTI